jgi:nucleoside transporter
MMFLQFFIWGAWYVTGPNYLGTVGFDATAFGWMYSVGPIAGLITPFFVGMIADRFFSAQRVMGLLHIAGGAIMWYAASQMKPGVSTDLINWLFFGHMLTYYPTLALANSMAMRNMSNSEKQFPVVRVFGTIGWIAAGLLLTWLAWDTKVNMFQLAAGRALILGVFAFVALPDTPPLATGKASVRQILGLDALVLLKDRSYLVFILSSALICIPLAFYYQIASRVVEMTGLPVGQTMSYGQMSEIIFMLLMPFFFARLGVKWMLAVGMLTWVARYALFAMGAPDSVTWMILIGVAIHGICYDFFFVTGQIYTDKVAPSGIRSQAQGLLVFFTLGLGLFIGAKVAARVEAAYTPETSMAAGKLVETKTAELEKLDAQIKSAPEAEKAALTTTRETLVAEKTKARQDQLKLIDWKGLWSFPAIFAGIVLVIFVLLFRNNVGKAVSKS